MLRRLPPLNAVRAFEAVARNGSVTRAARELSVTQGAVSRHVGTLEQWLGARLFVRTQRGHHAHRRKGRPTFARCAARSTRSTTRRASCSKVPDENLLRLKLPPTFAIRWLVPRLARFHALHPRIDVQITTSHERADFDREDIDACIHSEREPPPGPGFRRLVGEVLLPVCSPRLLTRGAPLASPADLARHVLLCSLNRPDDWPAWLAAAGVPQIDGNSGLKFENAALAYQAAIDELGVMIAQRALVAGRPAHRPAGRADRAALAHAGRLLPRVSALSAAPAHGLRHSRNGSCARRRPPKPNRVFFRGVDRRRVQPEGRRRQDHDRPQPARRDRAAQARPLAIDLDPQCHLTHIFGVHPRNADDSIYGFFMRQRPLDEVAQITKSGVIMLPAHLELAKLDSVLGKGVNVVTRLRQALHAPNATPGPVVIDCCPLLNVLSLNAIFAADLVLVPVSADFLSLKGAEQVERALNALEPVFKRRLPRRYLLTRYDARRRMTRRGRGAHARRCCAKTRSVARVIRENVKLAESPAVGLDVFRHAPGSRGAQRLRGAVRRATGCRLFAVTGAGADEADDAVDVERLEAARYALLLAIDDLAWWYIWRRRRSASCCVAAMIRMFSTRWPCLVRILNP